MRDLSMSLCNLRMYSTLAFKMVPLFCLKSLQEERGRERERGSEGGIRREREDKVMYMITQYSRFSARQQHAQLFDTIINVKPATPFN